ncbi:hypothetical protein AB7828_04945 [Tardiphaga sp. 215_C5_N2_1]|uniref:hypothetical protein n=1 Tax=Tardiphaga sp. 215_C5_N2_1 TaxID=3240774 RepID=UPI003F8C6C33
MLNFDPWAYFFAFLIAFVAALPKILRETRLLIREVRGSQTARRRNAKSPE